MRTGRARIRAAKAGAWCGTGQQTLLAIALFAYPVGAGAWQGVADGFALRNQNPFLQIFGLPTFQSATLSEPGKFHYDFRFDIANHADVGGNDREDFAVDGETYFLTLSLRRRISERLEVGVDVPFVSHGDGFLDNAIEKWHNTFGMSNTKRRGPSNVLGFRYTLDGVTLFELDTPAAGLGDMQFTAGLQLKDPDDNDGFALTLRSSVKLPTGDDKKLLGSGATDFSLGLYASDTHTFFEHALGISGFAGLLVPGDSDILGPLQRTAVPFGGMAATWHATDRLELTTQLYVQGDYINSELEELGGESIQLAVGWGYQWPEQGASLKLAIVEDVLANATADFGVHFSISWEGNR